MSEQKGLNNYLQLLLNNTEEIYVLLNTNCEVLYTNPETAGRTKFLMGMDVKAGVNVLDMVAPERRRALEEMYRKVFAGETVHKDYDILRNESRLYFEIQYKPIYNETRQVVAVLVTGRDVTQKKSAEAELIEREERWRFAMDVSNQGLWDWNILTGTVFYSNSWKTLLGFSQNEIGNHINEWLTRLHPDDVRQVELDLQKHYQSETLFYETTYRLRAKNGTYRWIHARGLLIEKTPDGQPARMIGTHLDITENKQHDEQYKELFDSNPLPTWIYGEEDGRILLVNKAAIEQYGYTREEFLNNSIEFIHPEDQWKKLKERRKREKNEKKLTEPVWIHQKKGGERIYVSLNSTSITYDNRTARLVVAHDITEKVNTEKQLKVSNERFRLAAKATSEVLWEWNLEEDIIYLSPVYEEMFGFKIETRETGSAWFSFIHPDERQEVTESFEHALRHPNTEHWEMEYRYRTADNSYLQVADHCIFIRDASGSAVKAVGSLQNITRRKQSEEEAFISNERFRLVTKATSDAIYDWDLPSNILWWGEGLYKLFGHHQITITTWAEYIHDEERDAVRASLEKTIYQTKKKYWVKDYRFRKADGSYGYVLERGFIVRDEEGRPVRMIGAIQDITGIKVNEQRLLESSERFDAVMRATHDMIWDWNLQTGNIYRDKMGMRNVYGVEDETSILTIDKWLQRIHPDDQVAVANTIEQITHKSPNSTFEIEYRFRRDDGTYSYVYDRGIILRNKTGERLRMIGAAHDITDRKKLEQELIRKELEKQRVISKATIDTQERERSEIGKELHDNVNQVLTTTKLYLELSQSNPELKDDLIGKATKNIMYVINEIRQLSRSLMNPSIGDLGLCDSVNDLVENINATRRMQVKFSIPDEVEDLLSENSKLMVYRIIQESLNNAIRHAHAKNVSIVMQKCGENVELQVADDGVGFSEDGVKKGAGLKSIQNRVYLANGTLKIESAAGKGCKLIINFPYNNSID